MCQEVTMSILVHLLLLCQLLIAVSPKNDEPFELTIIHTNDMHARFEQTNKYSGKCSERSAKDGLCYGGFARLAYKVKEIRKNDKNVVFLNAGDTYQGTLWYTLFKSKVVVELLNKLGPDAVSLGNHEFDDGIDGLLPYLRNATFPVLAANIKEDTLFENNLRHSVVINRGGRRIGVIGYLTPDTKMISQTEDTEFEDEVVAIKREAKKMKAEGINIIFAVGHSGFDTDRRIAKEVPEIDLVVGGHTNTFLYTGEQPDNEISEGPYPFLIEQTGGKVVPVVTAYAYTKYLGYLKVKIDNSGDLVSWEGSPILLDSSIKQDDGMQKVLQPWSAEVQEQGSRKIGSTKVFLNGTVSACRRVECNMGNVVADSMVQWACQTATDGWSTAAIAVVQGGGIRASIDEQASGGVITMEDVLLVSPFENALQIINLEGKHLLLMLEHSVAELSLEPTSDLKGQFLQVSGLRVVYNLYKPPGSRVVSVYARCRTCRVPEFLPLDENKVYSIIIPSFLVEGGDGFTMIKKNAISEQITDAVDSNILVEYIEKLSPVTVGLEGRIQFLSNEMDLGSQDSSSCLHFLAPSTLIYMLMTVTYSKFILLA